MALLALAAKDARVEWRGKAGMLAGLVVVLLFGVLDLFAFPSLDGQPRAAAAALWLPMVFGAAALCGASWSRDADRGTLDLMRLAPVGLGLHGAARTVVNGTLVALMAAVSLVVLGALFAIPVTAALALVLLLGALGLAVPGTLAGAVAAQARSREAILPVLLVPAVAPLVHAGIGATVALLSDATFTQAASPILLMAGYDCLALSAAWLLWPFVLEGD